MITRKQAQELADAARSYNVCRTQYRSLVRINYCLPKHKQKFIDEQTTKALVRLKNAEQKYLALERKYGKDLKLNATTK